MADFRKFSVLIAVAIMLGLAATASAQAPFSCTATAAVPPTLRAEGFTELVGDIVLDCTGGTPVTAGANPTANFTIFLTTPITSRTFASSLPALSEALLMVDEPGSGSQFLCAASSCATTAGATPSAANPNVFQGTITAANQVQFIGVPVNPPGTSGAHRIFRITNIRANANATTPGAGGIPGQIQALISVTGSTSVPVNNPTQIVGFASSGLTFAVRKGSDITASPNTTTDIQFAQCNTLSRTTTVNSFFVQWTENFPTSFKLRGSNSTTTTGVPGALPGSPQNTPGTIYNTESGFYPVAASGTGTTTSGGIGLADSGTRLKVIFNNIPAGVSVFVSTSMFSSTQGSNSVGVANAGQLLIAESGISGPATATNTDFKCNSATVCPGGTSGGSVSGYAIPVINGSATAVYEVTAVNPLASEAYNALAWFAYTAAVSTNSPAAGAATVTGGFAPTPSGLGTTVTAAAQASNSLNIPRFAEPTGTRNVFQVFTCRTNLLFPFVTNQGGFDTGIAIANTSTDPFGSSAQSGTCTLYSYGANAPASITTGVVNSGTVYTTVASSAMPNFQGYIIAQCQFQFAHGFAFVSDFGARNLAMGYLALLIPDPGVDVRKANPPGAQTTSGAGEGLGQ